MFMHHLILDLNDLVRINRAWQYKGPKVLVLQATVNLVQKGECWTWNQRFRSSILIGGNIFHWLFCFHVVISMMPILAISSSCENPEWVVTIQVLQHDEFSYPETHFYSGPKTRRTLVPWDPFRSSLHSAPSLQTSSGLHWCNFQPLKHDGTVNIWWLINLPYWFKVSFSKNWGISLMEGEKRLFLAR